MAVKPQDEYMHQNTGEAHFGESMCFNFFDRGATVGGVVRIGNRPNEGHADVTVALCQPDGSALFHYERPKITDNTEFRAGGARFEVLDPLRRLRVTFDGSAVHLRRPLDLEHPKRAFRDSTRRSVQLDLDYVGLSPACGGEADAAPGRYEQQTRAAGSVTVDARRVEINALGVRSHSWGTRSWESPESRRRLTCVFDHGFGFAGSQIVTARGAALQGGFVFKDGENHALDRLLIHTDWTGQGHYQDRIGVTLHSAAGEFRITGKVFHMLPLRNRRDGKATRIAVGMTLWRCGPHVGYGLSEYLDEVASARGRAYRRESRR